MVLARGLSKGVGVKDGNMIQISSRENRSIGLRDNEYQ